MVSKAALASQRSAFLPLQASKLSNSISKQLSVTKIQIFSFRKEKCWSVWSYDKNVPLCTDITELCAAQFFKGESCINSYMYLGNFKENREQQGIGKIEVEITVYIIMIMIKTLFFIETKKLIIYFRC